MLVRVQGGHDGIRFLGDGEMFHVSSAANRASIRRHGLDWTRMNRPGIAGSERPEHSGVFLCRTREDADFFIGMGDRRGEAVDVWAVDVSGSWLGGDPPGTDYETHWVILLEPVATSRVRLVEAARPFPAP